MPREGDYCFWRELVPVSYCAAEECAASAVIRAAATKVLQGVWLLFPLVSDHGTASMPVIDIVRSGVGIEGSPLPFPSSVATAPSCSVWICCSKWRSKDMNILR